MWKNLITTWSVLVLGGALAFGQIPVEIGKMEDTSASPLVAVTEKASDLTDLIPITDVIVVVLVLVIANYFLKFLSFFMETLARKFSRRRLFIMKMIPFVRVGVWIVALYLIIIGVVGPSRESLIAFSATAGIAVGFAAQDVLKNIFGGIIVLIDRPFQVGDLVDIGAVHGEVVSIGLRATRIHTVDDSIVSIPNAEVVSQSVSNANSGALDCQVVTEFLLPSTVDLIMVERICYEAAATSPYVYVQKPIVVRFSDDFQFDFLTKVKVKAYVYDHRLEVAFSSDITRRVKTALSDYKIFPVDPLTRTPLLRSPHTVGGSA
jgi:small-conductance mechanosensitive channel